MQCIVYCWSQDRGILQSKGARHALEKCCQSPRILYIYLEILEGLEDRFVALALPFALEEASQCISVVTNADAPKMLLEGVACERTGLCLLYKLAPAWPSCVSGCGGGCVRGCAKAGVGEEVGTGGGMLPRLSRLPPPPNTLVHPDTPQHPARRQGFDKVDKQQWFCDLVCKRKKD